MYCPGAESWLLPEFGSFGNVKRLEIELFDHCKTQLSVSNL